ncbi:MAG: hypothetical protein WC225_03540 [Acholeplasmataceae bacterium]
MNGTDKTQENNTITIGEGQTVNTHVSIGAANDGTGKTLVPVNRAAAENDVEVVFFTFTIEWKENGIAGDPANAKNNMTDGDEPTRKLEAVVQNIKIGGSDVNAGLVVTEVQIGVENWVENEYVANPNITLDGDSVKVFVKVTLTEPATQLIYSEIIKKTLPLM